MSLRCKTRLLFGGKEPELTILVRPKRLPSRLAPPSNPSQRVEVMRHLKTRNSLHTATKRCSAPFEPTVRYLIPRNLSLSDIA